MPDVCCRPGWQNGRVGHSGPAPSTSWLPIAARSDSFVALYLDALDLVIANAFWSTDEDGFSASRVRGWRWTFSFAVVAAASPVASPAAWFQYSRSVAA